MKPFRIWRWVCLVCALAALAAAAADKRPMTFLDVIEMRSPAQAAISPDGKYVLYTVSIPRWSVGKNFTDLFVAAADGSASPRQLTFTPEKNETQPAWARDSKTFGFLSDREGSNQLYLMRADGGEARKVSDAKDAVNAFAFSRDGKWVAYSAGKPEERQVWLMSLAQESAPVQLTHHGTAVADWAWSPDSARIFFTAPDYVDKDDQLRKEKKFDVRIVDQARPLIHLWSLNVSDSSEKRWTTGNAYGVADFTISPDGGYVAFRSASSNRYENPITEDDSEVYLLVLATGEVRRITNNHVAEETLVFSPDSRWLAFTAPDDFTYLRNDKLFLYPTAGGELRKLPGDWDHSARGPSWSADSKTVYFFEGIGVDRNLFALSVDDGQLTQLTREQGVFRGRGFEYETGLFVFTFTDPVHPADYYAARPETIAQRSSWMRLSNANPQIDNLQLGRTEVFHWKSSDGQTVEGLVIYPVGYERGRRYPLIVQVHGGPASAEMESFSANWGSYAHVYAGAGYAVFQPNYRGSDNYGEKFRMQIAGDYFRQAFDDIMTGVDALIARGVADSDKLGMMGWSAGGHWSDWTLTHTDRFKAISSGAGASDWISMYAQTDIQTNREFYFQGLPYDRWDEYVKESPLRYIHNARTPTLIHVGEADHRVPKPQSDELHMALVKLGVPTEYIVYPGMPHGLTEPRYQMVKMVTEFNWFEKWIRGKTTWFDWRSLLDTLPPGTRPPEKAESKGDAGR